MKIPASYHQERLWFIDIFESGNIYDKSPVYHNIPLILDINGPLDVRALEQSIIEVINRHEALRTRIVTEENKPFQLIDSHVDFKLKITDLIDDDNNDDRDQEDKYQGAVHSCLIYAGESFLSGNDSLIRGALFKVEENKALLVIVIHHIICDKISLEIMLREMAEYYDAVKNNRSAKLSDLSFHYVDFSQWQAELADEEIESMFLYWKRKLTGKRQVLELPTDYPRAAIHRYQAGRQCFTLPTDLCLKIAARLAGQQQQEARKHFVVLLAAFKILLYRYSRLDEIVVGTYAANRCQPGTEKVIGPLANLITLRSFLAGGYNVQKVVSDLEETLNDAFKYQEFPFEKLVSMLNHDIDMSRTTLFNVLFQYEENPLQDLDVGEITINVIETNLGWGKYDLNILIQGGEECFSGVLIYNKEYYRDSTISRLINHYKVLLESIFHEPNREISTLAILTKEERYQLLLDWNQTSAQYPKDKTIHQLFEEQVEKTPDSTAIVFGDRRVTYRRLNERANQLARLLREKGVGPDKIAAVMVERSLEMMIGIFAVQKGGGAYLPIEPNFPQKRINYLLKDSAAVLVLTLPKFHHIAAAVNFEGEVIALEDEPLYERESGNLDLVNTSKDTAYIIYTSGSSGMPKGVMIEHQGVMNRINWMQKFYPLDCRDVILQKTTYVFDVSVWELFWWCFVGACQCLLIPEGEKDPAAIIEAVERNNITTMHFVPSMLNIFLEYLQGSSALKKRTCLKQVFASGEALTPFQVEKFNKLVRQCTKKTRLINLYGPTEATIDVSYFDCPIEGKLDNVPIGKPIDNTKLFVVNDQMALQAIGLPGELCITGGQLARGYLNRPKLTSEKFIDNPFEEKKWWGPMYKKLYCTGDLAQWLPDGNIEYLGRTDFQVKIRGHRIELGEIESRLLSHKDIKEAVVIAKEFGGQSIPGDKRGERYLCAYVVSDKELTISQLGEYLSEELPAYMIPSYFVQLAELPLTANGKIDRKALPVPMKIDMQSGIEYVEPGTDVEKILAEIWEDVLGRKGVGVNDNFFLIGGDSIKAVRIVSRINTAGYKVEMKELFKYPTISRLAPFVMKSQRKVDQLPVTGPVPLTPLQHWFFAWEFSDIHHFNQAVMLYWQEGIKEEAVRAIFKKVQEHHDALRMTFSKDEEGNIIQRNNAPEYPLSLQVFDFQDHTDAEKEKMKEVLWVKVNEIQAGIDLEKGPLMKLGLFHMDDGDRLLIVIHHLVIDGVSWRILFEDLETLDRQYRQGKPFELPLKTDSFKVWSEKLSQYAIGEYLLKEVSYWQTLESAVIPEIQKDFSLEENYLEDTETRSFHLSESETETLLTRVNQAFGTEINEILLTALGLAVRENFALRHLLIALEGHGREEIIDDVDISRTVGWFTSIYPVLVDVSFYREGDDHSMARQIKEVKENLRRIPNRGIGYGILKYVTPWEHKEIDFQLKPQIIFNYLGQFDADVGQRSYGMAEEPVGHIQSLTTPREYQLEITGIITSGKLTLSVLYNKKQYRRETIGNLIDRYHVELGRIIAYCSARDTMELTPNDLTYSQLSIESLEQLSRQYPLEDIYPLTPMQSGMLFHTIYNPSSSAYFQQFSHRLEGELDKDIVRKSVDTLMRRYDILRTVFVHEGFERPLQLILIERQVEFRYEDLRDMDKSAGVAYIREFKEKDRNRSFNLAKDVLMRITLFRVEQRGYEFYWSYHHILMDGWCIGIIISDFLEIYRGFLENRTPGLLPVKPYRTYIQWLEKQDIGKSKIYWSRYLQDYEETASVPSMKGYKTGETGQLYRYEDLVFELDENKSRALGRLAASNQVTLNTVIQTIWGIILGKYTRRQDVVFGVVVSGRPPGLEDVESIVGLFINTIPVRINFNGKTSFNELLHNVQQEVIASEPFHYCPLTEIQSESSLKQNLLDHILVFENYPAARQIEAAGAAAAAPFEISNVEIREHSNYNFNIVILPGIPIVIKFIYNANVYDGGCLEKTARHFVRVLHQVLADEEAKIEGLTLLQPEEKQQLLYDFNDTARDYPLDKTVYRLFEEQAARTPGHTAVIGGGRFPQSLEKRPAESLEPLQITYGELNRESDRLALLLRQKGVGQDTIVAVMMERSVEMITVFLGIMKAGSAYLPIDLEYPQERIYYILADSKAKLLLAASEARVKVKEESIEVINISNLSYSSTVPASPSIQTVNYQAGYSYGLSLPGTLAYVIYTSGTTGRPKGTLMGHRSLVNLCSWHNSYYGVTGKDNATQYANIGFDASVWEIFPYLVKGASLHIIADHMKLNLRQLAAYYRRLNITISFLPTQFCRQFMEESEQIPSLRVLLTGGDTLNRFVGASCRLYNNYGPTENTVVATSCLVEANRESIPIGKPIDNTAVYILSRDKLQLQPVGIPGELCIGGVGLTRGYLNQPELTEERFDHDLWDFQDYQDEKKNRAGKKENYQKFLRGSRGQFFQKESPGRRRQKLYKTGDLARWLPDGNIEFLGRMDQQVKIRGYRIETAEIEKHLVEIDGIEEAVVVAKDRMTGDPEGKNTDKYLCAYVAFAGNIDKLELRNILADRLPSYMIPAHFVHLEKIPLTSSGKVARNALPDPEVGVGDEYAAPRNEIERKMVKIWADVLSLREENISIDANFFELGGHSLTAITLVTRIHEELNAKLLLNEVFAIPTIAQIARHLGGVQKQTYISIEGVEQKEYYPLSSAQRRMFVLQQLDLLSIKYNIPHLLPLRNQVNREKLENAFKKLVERHEILRTSIGVINHETVQIIHNGMEFSLQYHEIPTVGQQDMQHPRRIEEATKEILKQFVRPFDLTQPPFLRAALINTGLYGSILLIDMHHIISDERTMEIITEEIKTFYNNKELSPLKLQYKDYAQWQNQMCRGDDVYAKGIMEQQETYWLKKFAGELPVLDLPTDYPRPEVQCFNGRYVSFEIDMGQTQAVIELSISLDATVYMILLAVYNILLAKLSGQEDIIIGGPVAGRRYLELDKLVGMFINMLPMRNLPEMNKTFKEFLTEVKANVLEDLDNQDYPFDELVEKLGIKRVANRSPLFDTAFYFQSPKRSMMKMGKNTEIEELPENLPEYEHGHEHEHKPKFSKDDFQHNISYAELGVFSYQLKNRIKFELKYHIALYKQETVERMAHYYKNILEQVVADPGIRLSDLQLFSQQKTNMLSGEDVRANAFLNQTKEKIEADFAF
jgi:amino acid adenylation domain-containing protein/non-ribosomal peptide synthase protein (TIGR01720 family)